MNNGKYALYIFMTVLSGIGVLSAYGDEPGTPRLAVGVYRDGTLDESLTERLDVALAAEPDLAVVDRRLLARLFDEWHLGAMSRAHRNALEMGRLQGVDYFVWIDVPTDSASGFMEIVDTTTGFGVAGVRTPTEFAQLRSFVLSQIRRLPADIFTLDTDRTLAVSRPAVTPDIPENTPLTRRLMHDLSEALIAARIPLLHRHRVEQLVSESWRAQKGVVELTDVGRGLRGASAILIPRISFETTAATLELVLVDAVTGTRLAAATWVLPIDDGRLLLPATVMDWTREILDDLDSRSIMDQTPDPDRLQPETLKAFYRGVLLFNEGRYLEAMEYFAESSGADLAFPHPIRWIQACFAATGFDEVAESLDDYFESVTTYKVQNIPFYYNNWKHPQQTPGVNFLGLTCRDPELTVHGGPILDGLLAELNAQGHGPVFLNEDLSDLKREYDALVGIETATEAGWRQAPLLLFENMISAHLFQTEDGWFVELVRVDQIMPPKQNRTRIRLENDPARWQTQLAKGVARVFGQTSGIAFDTAIEPLDDEPNLFELHAQLQHEFKNSTWLKLMRRHPVLGSKSGSFAAPSAFSRVFSDRAWPESVKRGLDDWLIHVLPDDDPRKARLSIRRRIAADRSQPDELNRQMQIVAHRFPEHPIALAVRFNKLLLNLSPENYRQSREALETMINDERSELMNNRLRSLHAALSVALGERYELPVSRRGVPRSAMERAAELSAENRWFAEYNKHFILQPSDFLSTLNLERRHPPHPRSRMDGELAGQLFLRRLLERYDMIPPRDPIVRANEYLEHGSGIPDAMVRVSRLIRNLMNENPEDLCAEALLKLCEQHAAEVVRFFDNPRPLRTGDAFQLWRWIAPFAADQHAMDDDFMDRLQYCSDVVRHAVVSAVREERYRNKNFARHLGSIGWLERRQRTEDELLAAADEEWERIGRYRRTWAAYMYRKRASADDDEWRQTCLAAFQRLKDNDGQILEDIARRNLHALAYLGQHFYLLGDDERANRIHHWFLALESGAYRAHAWHMLVLTARRAGNLPHAFNLAQRAIEALDGSSGALRMLTPYGGHAGVGVTTLEELRAFVEEARQNPNIPFDCPVKRYRARSSYSYHTYVLVNGFSAPETDLSENLSNLSGDLDEPVSPEGNILEMALSHPHPGIGIMAAGMIENPDELLRIVLNARHWVTRTVALEPLMQQDHLAQIAIASRDSNIRYTAMTKLSDPALLAEVPLASHDWRLRQDIVKRLEDPTVLAHFAVEDPVWPVRLEAVNRIDDQTLLRRIAIHEADRDVRVVAVRKIDDQELLARTAKHDADALVRSVAAGKLNDQNHLAHIAMTDANKNVRTVAGRRVTDQETLKTKGMWFSERIARTVNEPALLADLLQNSLYENVRSIALDRISDDDLRNLVDIKTAAGNVGLEAVKRFDDPAWLAEMAIDAQHAAVREAAFEKTDDPRYLAKIIIHTIDWNLRVSAMKRLTDREVIAGRLKWMDPQAVRRIDDPETIRQLSLNARDTYVRHAAVGTIEDQALLARIASEDPDAYVRSEAVNRIDDRKILAQFAVRDQDAYVRHTAAGRLRDQDLLFRIAIEDGDAFAQRTATRQITNSVLLTKVSEMADHVSVRRTAIEGLSTILPSDIPLALRYPRMMRANTLRAALPECDEIQWGLRHHAWFSPRIAVAGAGHFEKRFAIPPDYEVLHYADDTLILRVYDDGKPVAQGTTTFRSLRSHTSSSFRRAMTEATYGVMGSRRGDLIALLKGAQPDLPMAHSLNETDTKSWDVAVVDALWLKEQGEGGPKTVMDFLARGDRRVLLAGVMRRNPFLPAWAMPAERPNHPQSDPSTATNTVIVVDAEHAALRAHNAADWLTFNDWNHVPPSVPAAGEDSRPMNLRPIYADTVSGAPFIVELFPPEGGRLLCIPLDLVAALDNEIYAGYLLYRALQYLGQNTGSQWRDVAYRDHPATERWLHAIGVTAPHPIGEQDVPKRIDQVLIFRSDSINAPLERWIRAGGTAIRLTNKRGLTSEPPANDRYRGLLRGIAMPLIADYAAVLVEDEQAWQALLPAEYARRPVIPGVLDEVSIGAGRLLVLAVPDTITPPARNLLSILLTNYEVRLGPQPKEHADER